MKNPWLGLSSYTEESLKEYQFNGRTTAITALTALIRNNLFVTLYGKSGIGKTSLLQAGIFPMLRQDGMFPVLIRLNEVNDNGSPAAELLWKKILAELNRHGYSYMPCDSSDVYKPDFTNVMVLRNLFSAGRFINRENREAIAVVVLDQFEEILYNAPEASRLLITQLYSLIDDNYNINVSHPTWHDDTNFRIVASIREDDLYLFEDLIDTLNCVDFKSNRYRLISMTKDEAMEVILKPAEGIFESGHQTEIAEKIIALAQGNGQSINTLMLSLTCHVLFNKFTARGHIIKLSDLSSYNDTLETYYQETMDSMHIPKEEQNYIENHLIDEQGRRTSIYLSDLERHAPNAKRLLSSPNNRLLNLNQGRVELIHDRIAVIVNSKRNIEFEKQRFRSITISLSLYMILATYIVWNSISDILRFDWALIGNNLNERITAISDIDINDINIPVNYLISSSIMANLILIFLIIYKIPRGICNFFYSSWTKFSFVTTVIGTFLSWLLGSSIFFKFVLQSNGAIYPIIGWLTLITLYLVSIYKTSKYEK